MRSEIDMGSKSRDDLEFEEEDMVRRAVDVPMTGKREGSDAGLE
jgi:hypothetical protein